MRDISKIIVERSAACSAWPAGLDAALSQRGYGFQRTNAAALNLYQLYRRAGFEESSIYHYRTATPRALTIASRASGHLSGKHSGSCEIIAGCCS